MYLPQHTTQVITLIAKGRVKNPGFFLKKPNPLGFLGFIGFFGQAGKIGKIIQKLSNSKP